MAKYTTNRNMIHGGQLSKVGETIELTSAQAERLGEHVTLVKENTATQDATAKATKRTAENPEKETAKKKKRG